MSRRTSRSANLLRMQLGENVMVLRRRRGLSQEELGELASLHRTEVGQLERGTRLPRLDTILRLCAALGITPNDLLAGMAWNPGHVEAGSFSVEEICAAGASSALKDS